MREPSVLSPIRSYLSYTPFTPSNTIWYNISAMNKENINNLEKAYDNNLASLHTRGDNFGRERRLSVAFLATIIDYLRGDIEGLTSPLSDLARNPADSSHPSPPDNGDPEPIVTEVMKLLGSLGLQSLSELKGYKYDDEDHFLLHIKGRLADSGWMRGDPHIGALINTMGECRLPFEPLQ